MIDLKIKLFLLAILFPGLTGCRLNTVQGNGQVTTREFQVEDFSAIRLEGVKIRFEYTQQAGPSGLSVTLDENLFEDLQIETAGSCLIIAPKNKQSQLIPTQFRICARSPELTSLEKIGSGEFTVFAPLACDELQIRLAGRNTVLLQDTVAVTHLNIKLAGNNTFETNALVCNRLEGRAAGKNKFLLKGKVHTAAFDLAGSNKIDAAACRINSLESKSAGTATIKAHVTDRLKYNSAGKISVTYRGNPAVIRQTAGISTVTHMD